MSRHPCRHIDRNSLAAVRCPLSVVVISGPADAYAGDPRSESTVSAPEILASLHGVYAEDRCAQYLVKPVFELLNPKGGRVRIVYCDEDNRLRVTTTYDVSRAPDESEMSALVEETTAQWSDGIGGGSFANHKIKVLSTTLAMALRNAGDTNVAALSVDICPLTSNEEIQVDFLESGSSDDALIADLIMAADDSDTIAMIQLGQRYQSADGVPQDDHKAFRLFSAAAEQRHPFAIALLGICHELGNGCPENRSKAIMCFQDAVKLDSPLGMICLGEMYEAETPEKSVALYKRGAALGEPGCVAQLGECFEYGKGVDIDLDEALACYRRSIELGIKLGLDAVLEAIERVESGRRS